MLEFKQAVSRLVLQIEKLSPNFSDSRSFLEDILCKLSRDTYLELYRHYGKTDFTYTEIDKGLQVIINLMEVLAIQPSHGKKSFHNISDNSGHNPVQEQKKVFPKQNFNSSSTKPPTNKFRSGNVNSCIFCFNNHSSRYCTNYSSVDSRKDRIKQLSYCFKCLKSGHKAVECKESIVCRNCNKAHHTFCVTLVTRLLTTQ